MCGRQAQGKLPQLFFLVSAEPLTSTSRRLLSNAELLTSTSRRLHRTWSGLDTRHTGCWNQRNSTARQCYRRVHHSGICRRQWRRKLRVFKKLDSLGDGHLVEHRCGLLM